MTLGQMTYIETSRTTSDNHGLKMGVGGTRALAHLYIYIFLNTHLIYPKINWFMVIFPIKTWGLISHCRATPCRTSSSKCCRRFCSWLPSPLVQWHQGPQVRRKVCFKVKGVDSWWSKCESFSRCGFYVGVQ